MSVLTANADEVCRRYEAQISSLNRQVTIQEVVIEELREENARLRGQLALPSAAPPEPPTATP